MNLKKATQKTIELYGEYMIKQDNVASLFDGLSYGFKRTFLDLKEFEKRNKITEVQRKKTLEYIYETQFKHYEDEAFQNFSYNNIHCEDMMLIGKIEFNEVKKGEHNLSMGMPQVLTIILISMYVFEEIMDKSFQEKDYIEDKWLNYNVI